MYEYINCINFLNYFFIELYTIIINYNKYQSLVHFNCNWII